MAPDVIVASGGAATEWVLQATRIVPIVFAIVIDPLGSGFVNNLSRPGGNATGFMQFEYNLCAKWLDLLRQIAPGMRRVAVMREPATTGPGPGSSPSSKLSAPSLGLEVTRSMCATSRGGAAVTAFAGTANGGLDRRELLRGSS